MSDRADYLARTVVRRLRAIDAIAREDFASGDERQAAQRLETLAKILAVDAGVTDGITVRAVLSAVPHLPRDGDPSAREMREFAEFLRKRLPEF